MTPQGRVTEFTPGPWTIPHFADDCNCGCGYVFANNDRMGAVATVHYSENPDWQKYGDDPPRGEAIANAHLIAAAPDMYAALELAAGTIDQMEAAMKLMEQSVGISHEAPSKTDQVLFEIMLRINAALARARGEAVVKDSFTTDGEVGG